MKNLLLIKSNAKNENLPESWLEIQKKFKLNFIYLIKFQ